MNKDQLHQVAKAMVAPGKGILAADESTSTIKKRFDDIKVENTEENRRDYREFMFRSQQAMRNHISGVILFDETIRQTAKDGTPLVKIIEDMGAIPGIKVDKSAHPMPGFPGETITEGLDGLPKRMKEYHGLGAGLTDVLEELFDQIHRALLFVGGSYEETAGMGATLSLCWFTSGWMYFGHIGDSRIYYLPARAGGIRQISMDDTYVGWLYRQGKLNEREARTHPRRNVLQKALGAGNQFVDPQVGAVACEPGDIFLLCTDGLVDGFYDAALLERLRAPGGLDAARDGDVARQLVDDAVECAGRDNTTALVVEVLADEPEPRGAA